MGTEIRYLTIKGKTLKDAWDSAVEEDTYDRGHDYYNSSIRSCSPPRLVPKITKELEYGLSKGYALAELIKAPVANTNKVKSEVTNFPCKAARVWETEYYAIERFSTNSPNITDPSQTECIRKARAYVEANPNSSLEIHIRKKLVKQSTKVAEINYKKSSNESDGTWNIVAATPC
jgi:hypothetical protein